MDRETITDLGYATQLLYPPRILNKDLLRKMYVELANILNLTESKELLDGINFISQSPGKRESTKYLIKTDRTVVQTAFTTTSLDFFCRKVEAVVKQMVRKFKIPIFISQVCTVRLLATPKPTNDSREFIGNMVCGFQKENLSLLARPMQTVGIRFYFPQVQNNLFDFNVKVESRMEDVTKIWLENTARFFRPIPNDTISVIHDNLSKTREFLTKNIADFLAQYNESSKKNERGGPS